MASATNQSATTEKSLVYKQSQKEFRKKALIGDYTNKKKGWEQDNSTQGYKDRLQGKTLDPESDDSESKDKFYKQALGPNYQRKEPPAPKANTKKGKKVKLKDFLKMYGNFKNKNEFVAKEK